MLFVILFDNLYYYSDCTKKSLLYTITNKMFLNLDRITFAKWVNWHSFRFDPRVTDMLKQRKDLPKLFTSYKRII